jgi:hypothetical protein
MIILSKRSSNAAALGKPCVNEGIVLTFHYVIHACVCRNHQALLPG